MKVFFRFLEVPLTKAVFFVFFTSYFFSTTKAQSPIITSSINYADGDFYLAYRVDTSTIDLSLVGTDVTWNIDNSSIASESFTKFIGQSIANTPYSTDFSSSSVSVKDSVKSAYSFFTTYNDRIELDGFGEFTGITHFSDPGVLITFPFTYGSSVNDNIIGTLDIGVTFTISGTINSIADAYGNLVLPWGTYPVLRIKTFQHAVATNQGGTITTDLTSYSWYTESSKYPLMRMDSSKINGTGFYYPDANGYFKESYITLNSPLSVNENITSNFLIYPNPCHGVINLSLKGTSPNNPEAILIDIIGQKTSLKLFSAFGTNNYRIDVGDFPAGVYILQLKNNNITNQQKLVINN